MLLKFLRKEVNQKKKSNFQSPEQSGLFSSISPMNLPVTQETYSIISKDFQLPEVKEEFSEEKAIEILAKAISQLMDRNLERLLQICYRVDLSENRLKQILYESEPDRVAFDLAKALWERQKQKVEIRRRYSGD